MAIYQYTAKKMDGSLVRGRMQAADEEQAYSSLKTSGLYLVRIRKLKVRAFHKMLSLKALSTFSRELSVMMKAGIPLAQSLNMLQLRETNPSMAALYQNLYLSIAAGNCLSKAMEDEKTVFSPLMVQMVRAGEEGGKLEESIERLADYYEKDDQQKKQLTSALIYPAFLFFLTIAAVIIMFTVVLPNFFELFETMESLPASTRFLLWLSKAMRDHSVVMVSGMLILILLVCSLLCHPVAGKMADRLLLKLPLIGGLAVTIYTSRFARTLSSLYVSGIALPQAMRTAANVLDNRHLKFQLERARKEVCNGMPLSAALAAVEGLDNRFVTEVFIGEESGDLGTMLDHIADSFDFSAREAARRMTALAEPVMIVILAVLIGCIMLSVMVPIYQYYQTLS